MTLLVPVDFDSCIPIFCTTVIKIDDFCNLTDTPLRLLQDYTKDGGHINLSLPKGVLRSILRHFSLPSPYLSTKVENAARHTIVENRNDRGHRLLCMLTGNSR